MCAPGIKNSCVEPAGLKTCQDGKCTLAPLNTGCAEGLETVTFVPGKGVGCDGTWSNPGIASGAGLCAPGWDICKSASAVKLLGVTSSMCSSCSIMAQQTFYATLQSSQGSFLCKESGTNDVWGCGCNGPNQGTTCDNVFSHVLADVDWHAWKGLGNGHTFTELEQAYKTSGNGGLMCCKFAIMWPPWALTKTQLVKDNSSSIGMKVRV